MSLIRRAEAGDEALLRKLDRARLPRHIAVIMDGSGRWAGKRMRPRVSGHLAGVRAVRSTVETCARLAIPALTLYAFSAENWRRPEAEVNFLMRLLRRYLRSETENLRRQNIRLAAIGRTAELPESVQADLTNALTATASCTGMVLTLALNYGARAELVDACQALVNQARLEGRLDQLRISETALGEHLYTARLPEPDLLIRTSGEMRVSNFLLWQIAYAEIWVTPVLWPDFDERELVRALLEYQSRERRFGGLGAHEPARARRKGAVSA
ncbi:MAG TPA: isoprenyl transferase [Terriglobales bacterium]|nr:isoprenyl transferase [Terriglobales bacterium]